MLLFVVSYSATTESGATQTKQTITRQKNSISNIFDLTTCVEENNRTKFEHSAIQSSEEADLAENFVWVALLTVITLKIK